MSDDKITHLEIGPSDIIEIEKIYGPLVMTDLRISIDINRGEWVIERQIVPNEGEMTWEVCARIDGQNSIDFHH